MDCVNFLELFLFNKTVQGRLTLLVIPMDSGLGFDISGGFARHK